MILIGEDNATWADAKRELQDVNFKTKLRDLDVEKIPVKAYKKVIKEYLTNAKFNPTEVYSDSAAAGTLCQWVVAITKYG